MIRNYKIIKNNYPLNYAQINIYSKMYIKIKNNFQICKFIICIILQHNNVYTINIYTHFQPKYYFNWWVPFFPILLEKLQDLPSYMFFDTLYLIMYLKFNLFSSLKKVYDFQYLTKPYKAQEVNQLSASMIQYLFHGKLSLHFIFLK